jgi:formylglycine-generating enzyme required for sulfatase activity
MDGFLATPGNVKRLLPPRQSRGVSHSSSVTGARLAPAFLLAVATVSLAVAFSRAAAGQAAARAPRIPDEDGLYSVVRLSDHADSGYAPVTTRSGPAWAQVGERLTVTLAQVTSQTPANDRYRVSYGWAKARTDACGAVVLRVDGTWRFGTAQQSSYLSCNVQEVVDDVPKGTVARIASVLGTTPTPWVVTGDRVTGVFAPSKPVFQQGDTIAIIFTLHNPADAPPVSHAHEPVARLLIWHINATRDGTPLAGMNGAGIDGGIGSEVLWPGGSSTTTILLLNRIPGVGPPGHYVVEITHPEHFSPADAADGGRGASNPGGDQTFTGTVEFDIANALVAGTTTVRGRVTGDPALVARVGVIWLRAASTQTASVGLDGSFVFSIVRPGSYDIGTPNPMAPLRQIVVDSGRPLDVEIPVLSEVVHGRVTTTGGPPPAPFALSIGDGPFSDHPITLAIIPALDGTFETTVPRGRWIVGIATGLPPGDRLTALKYGSVDLLSEPPAARAPVPPVTMSVVGTSAALAIELSPIVPAPMTFVSVAPGTFMMGCSSGDTTCMPSQGPAHQVRISRPFELGVYEVTRTQWKAVMTTLPATFPMGTVPAALQSDDRRPVESVSWTSAQEFLRRLNSLHDGYHYRLPTEAEWEYAARAGDTTSGRASADETAWFRETSAGWTHPVGQKAPNAWGLYDMLGNVDELVQDFYGPYVAGASQVDPTGPATGTAHVIRGGSAEGEARTASLSSRYPMGPDAHIGLIGFRVVREPSKSVPMRRHTAQ